MANIQIKFGSLALDITNNITIESITEKAVKNVKTVDIPMSDGAIAEIAKISPKSITIRGDVCGTSYDNLRANIDTLHAGLLNGMQKITKDDERYIYAQLKDFNYAYDHPTRRATWTANFIAHYPFWLAETATTDTRAPASGVGYVVANAGNAPTRVKVEITAAISTADACQFENTTKGQLFVYRGTIGASDKLEVDNRYDTDDFQVLNDSISDMPNFEGDFITLDAGNNTMEYTGAGTGANAPSIKLSWRSCWY